MEDRLTPGRRPALALTALALILLVGASWWALALWPVGGSSADWLMQVRAVCFGNVGPGLPSLGGWVLLMGEPVGMLAILFITWGDAVHEGLRVLRRSYLGRLVLAASLLALLGGAGWAAQRIREARGIELVDVTSAARIERIDGAAPPLRLINQAGDSVGPSQYTGRMVLVAFAYGHCETVCPLIVHDIVAAVRKLGSAAPEVLLVTLDPWRDTPARLGPIARSWDLPSGVHLLSGDVDVVQQTLDAWQVPRTRDPQTGELIHARVAYLLGPDGRMAYRLDGAVSAVEAAVAELSGLSSVAGAEAR